MFLFIYFYSFIIFFVKARRSHLKAAEELHVAPGLQVADPWSSELYQQ